MRAYRRNPKTWDACPHGVTKRRTTRHASACRECRSERDWSREAKRRAKQRKAARASAPAPRPRPVLDKLTRATLDFAREVEQWAEDDRVEGTRCTKSDIREAVANTLGDLFVERYENVMKRAKGAANGKPE